VSAKYSQNLTKVVRLLRGYVAEARDGVENSAIREGL